jgi:hypothetical protein
MDIGAEDHRRLRMLAAEADISMTNAAIVAIRLLAWVPSKERDTLIDLFLDEDTAGWNLEALFGSHDAEMTDVFTAALKGTE